MILQGKKCKCILLFTDTDSLCIEIEENFYEIMHEFKELFDLSNFSKDSKYYCDDNKKVPGKMKDEYGGTVILEYAGTKTKMYSILDISNYEKVYTKDIIQILNMMNLKILHRTCTYESNKISLSAFNDKRCILADGINTLAYGHKGIPK